jgi:hypothetical protein
MHKGIAGDPFFTEGVDRIYWPTIFIIISIML